MEELQIKVFGKVQGVGFRSFVKDEADKFGLKGYVKNTSDGGVEVVAQGDKEKLEKLLNSIRKDYFRASVDKIYFSWNIMKDKYDKFIIAFN